jgi:hypothetical protein
MINFVTVGDLICVMRTMYNVCTRQLCEHLWTKIQGAEDKLGQFLDQGI